jgi:hypothetical protein
VIYKLEETIRNRVDDVLSSVDWWTQYLCKEPNMKIEGMQLGLQALTMSLYTWARSPHEEILDTKFLTSGSKEHKSRDSEDSGRSHVGWT